MTRQIRADYERKLARLHVERIIQDFGQTPRGIHVVIVPASTWCEIWQDEAALAIREIRMAGGGGLDEFDPPVLFVHDMESVSLRSSGIESGIDNAACTFFFADTDNDGLDHRSIDLADNVLRPELDINLLIQAAALCGRQITEADATMLAEMPWRRRRIAVLSPRPIAETYRIHSEAQAAEDQAKAAEGKGTEKTASKWGVLDVIPLEDMHGYGDAKEWGLELARDIEDWRLGDIPWTDVDTGILISGPPGCGKTSFAAALAKTLGAHLVIGSYSAWLGTGDGHQGDLIKSMRGAFDEARKNAPAVVLIDEIDNFVARGSIGHGRSDEWMRGAVNALLECLDGAVAREGVIVIGATNDASGIDMALRRPGRLDRHIQVSLPDADARIKILRQHLQADLDLHPLIRHTDGMSGADLERVARDARRFARRERTEVGLQHVERALPERVRRPPAELHLIAIHELGHAVVNEALGVDKLLGLEVALERVGGGMIAGVAVLEPIPGARRDKAFYSKKLSQILGGMAIEQLLFGCHTDGSVVDLRQASNLATYMLVSAGMGDTLVADGRQSDSDLADMRRYDPHLSRRVDELLHDALDHARDVVTGYRFLIERLADQLTATGRLEGSVVRDAVRRYSADAQLSLAV